MGNGHVGRLQTKHPQMIQAGVSGGMLSADVKVMPGSFRSTSCSNERERFPEWLFALWKKPAGAREPTVEHHFEDNRFVVSRNVEGYFFKDHLGC